MAAGDSQPRILAVHNLDYRGILGFSRAKNEEGKARTFRDRCRVMKEIRCCDALGQGTAECPAGQNNGHSVCVDNVCLCHGTCEGRVLTG